MNEIFDEQLLDGEELLWVGKPTTAVTFVELDTLLIGFTILLDVFLLPILIIAFIRIKDVNLEALIYTIPFVLIALYLTFGRFIYKSLRNKYTLYAVTNLRVIEVRLRYGKQVKSRFIDKLKYIEIVENTNGTGNIIFMENVSPYFNTGLDIWSNDKIVAFVDIKDYEDIAKTIQNRMGKDV